MEHKTRDIGVSSEAGSELALDEQRITMPIPPTRNDVHMELDLCS